MLFQNTIDTSGYMIAGYAIFFAVTIIYVASLLTRWKKLEKDLQTLKELED
ncbi:MAG: hypothetical protein HN736_00905 [Anaerolineae bacterium]|nr:hypothetical protein [Anaerolineae bacterium]MBT3713324.1 hypothetical protein [Anaerolineae bacterium]MBT4310605.1 hypothetical protein [Anaerolineae bacterium]MBT4459008.1 hypothetical protein [Anaerolineae bacterium]MBT4842602.1 hypothetical protein [Anaerolineae bacterium]